MQHSSGDLQSTVSLLKQVFNYNLVSKLSYWKYFLVITSCRDKINVPLYSLGFTPTKNLFYTGVFLKNLRFFITDCYWFGKTQIFEEFCNLKPSNFSNEHFYNWKIPSHLHLIVMFEPSPGRHYEPRKSSNFSGEFDVTALWVLLTKALYALKESPDGCDKDFFEATIFDKCQVQLCKLFTLK